MTTTASFDERAKEWDTDPRVALARSFAGALTDAVELTARMAVLEFGCGTGLVSMEMYRRVGSIIMADLSEGMLEVLRGKIERAGITTMRLYRGDLAGLEAEGAGLDGIYTLMTLHHVADLDGMFKQFARLLKPGGFLAIGDLEPEDGSFHQPPFDGHFGFDGADLACRLARQGLEAGPARRIHVVQKPAADGTMREYPVFFLLARKR